MLVDVQQVIPLPEAQDYIVRIREKALRERQDRAEQGSRHALRQAFWQSLLERSSGETGLFGNVSPSQATWISTGAGFSGASYVYNVTRHSSAIQYVLDGHRATNKARFDWLLERRKEVEESFGGQLTWRRSDAKKESGLAQEYEGGYRDDAENWPAIQDRMIDAMVLLDRALRPYVDQLRRVAAEDEAAGYADSGDIEGGSGHGS